MSYPKRFTLTEEHIRLLRHAYVRWEDCEYGAPAIDCKRPFGNSSVERDIIDILGWPWPKDDYDEPPGSLCKKAAAIHRELEAALQIVLCTGAFEPGTYQTTRDYDDVSWRKLT